MPTITRSTYIKLAQKRGRGWLKNKYKDAWGEGARPIYKAYANQWANGYNKIVSNWSAESKPRFVGVATYIKSTGNWFVRVQIVGTQVQKDRFQMLDFGAPRGQDAGTPDVSGKDVALGKGFKKQLHLRVGDMMDYAEFQQAYLARITKKKRKRGRPKKYDLNDAYNKYVARTRKQYTKYFREGQPTTAREYARAARRSMMPMYRYASKTGRAGRIGGSGSKGTPLGWKHDIKLGAIDARLWTVGLKSLVDTSRDPYGVRKIWPGMKQWSTVVRNAYAAGSAAANRQSS